MPKIIIHINPIYRKGIIPFLNGLPPVMMTPTLLISKFLACFLEVHTEYLPPTTFNMLTLWIWEVSD